MWMCVGSCVENFCAHLGVFILKSRISVKLKRINVKWCSREKLSSSLTEQIIWWESHNKLEKIKKRRVKKWKAPGIESWKRRTENLLRQSGVYALLTVSQKKKRVLRGLETPQKNPKKKIEFFVSIRRVKYENGIKDDEELFFSSLRSAFVCERATNIKANDETHKWWIGKEFVIIISTRKYFLQSRNPTDKHQKGRQKSAKASRQCASSRKSNHIKRRAHRRWSKRPQTSSKSRERESQVIWSITGHRQIIPKRKEKKKMFSCHLLVTSLFVSLFVYFLSALQKQNWAKRKSADARWEPLEWESSRLESIEVEWNEVWWSRPSGRK